MNWIPLARRKPHVLGEGARVPVLFFAPRSGVCAGWYFKEFNMGFEVGPTFKSLQGACFPVRDVTHWMPMPAPPKQRKNR